MKRGNKQDRFFLFNKTINKNSYWEIVDGSTFKWWIIIHHEQICLQQICLAYFFVLFFMQKKNHHNSSAHIDFIWVDFTTKKILLSVPIYDYNESNQLKIEFGKKENNNNISEPPILLKCKNTNIIICNSCKLLLVFLVVVVVTLKGIITSVIDDDDDDIGHMSEEIKIIPKNSRTPLKWINVK